jgi:hypothetical protein
MGRRIHTRTVSLTRTWTSRQPIQPDWLLWARRGSVPVSAESQVDENEVDNTGAAPDKSSDPDPEMGVLGMTPGDHDVTRATSNQACV